MQVRTPKTSFITLRVSRARAGRGIRPEIEGPVRTEAAHEPQGRKLLLQVQAQAEIILIVPQHDIVAGLVLLDEVALQDQGLPAAGGDEKVHPGHLLQHQGGLGVVPVRRLEIRADAVPQIDRLADIDDLAGRVFEQVDAAGAGHLAQGRGQGRIGRSNLYFRFRHLMFRITGRLLLDKPGKSLHHAETQRTLEFKHLL